MDTHDFTMQKTRHPYHASNGRVHARRVPAGGKHSYFFHSFSFDKDGCQLSVVSCQLSVVSYQLPVVSYQISDQSDSSDQISFFVFLLFVLINYIYLLDLQNRVFHR